MPGSIRRLTKTKSYGSFCLATKPDEVYVKAEGQDKIAFLIVCLLKTGPTLERSASCSDIGKVI